MFSIRPMTWFASCMAAGILLAQYNISVGIFYTSLLAVAYILYILGTVIFAEKEKKPESPFSSTSLTGSYFQTQVLLLSIGVLFLCGGYRLHMNSLEDTRTSRKVCVSQKYGEYEFTVINAPEISLGKEDVGKWRCEAEYENADGAVATVRLYGTGPRDILRGDKISGKLKWLRNRRKEFPDAFDMDEYMRVRGIHGRAYFDRKQSYIVTHQNAGGVMGKFDDARKYLVRRLLKALPDERGAFLAATMFGYRSEIDESIRNNFRDTGIAHVLAISGLHVGLVVGLVWMAFSLVIYDRRILGAICIVSCIAYVGLSGGRTAALRAGIMAVVYLSGYVISRKSDFINSLGIAALIIMLMNTMSVFGLGFQLSFVAVLFISRLLHEIDSADSHGIVGRLKRDSVGTRKGRMLRSVSGIVGFSIAAWLGVWPLTAYAFGMVSPIGLISNIVALPLMSGVLAGGFFSCIVGMLPDFLSQYLLWLTALPSQLMLLFAENVSLLPGAGIIVARPSEFLIVLYYSAFILFFCRRIVRLRILRKASLFLIVASVLAMALTMSPATESSKSMSIVSGREGESIIVNSDKQVMIVSGQYNISKCIEYNKNSGIDSVDLVYVIDNKLSEANAAALSNYSSEVIRIPYSGEDLPYIETFQKHGVKLFVSRDKKKNIVWKSIKHDGVSIAFASRSWSGQVLYRLKKYVPSEILFVNIRDWSRIPTLRSAAPNALIFANTNKIIPKLVNRRAYGVIRIGTDSVGRLVLDAYDGKRWQSVNSAK